MLLDIDQLRSSQQHLVEAHHFASSVVESVPVPIVVLDKDFSIRTANTAFRELSQLSAKELESRSLPDFVHLLWGIDSMRERLQELLDSPTSRLEFEHESHTTQKKTLFIKGQVLSTQGDRVLLLMMEDITLRREAEQITSQQKAALESEIEQAATKLNRTKEELRGLTSHLFKVQEEERERIARELHDDVSQRLSLMEILLTNTPRESRDESSRMEEARHLLRSLNIDVREMSHRLHPAILKDLGLPSALEALMEEFERREEMPTTFSSGELPRALNEDAATAVYRITQEALRNVAKHAGKTHVKVSLQSNDGALELRVKDFGNGFSPQSLDGRRGLGMISMQERARMAGGKWEIQSEPGNGTTIMVRIPLEDEEQRPVQ